MSNFVCLMLKLEIDLTVADGSGSILVVAPMLLRSGYRAAIVTSYYKLLLRNNL